MRYLFFIGLYCAAHGVVYAQQKDTSTITSFFLQPIEIKTIRVGDRTPFTKTNLNKQIIATQNIGQDLPFLLNQTPSVVINSDAGTGIGYTGIRIRGTDATRINITINGIPYNDAESQGVFFVNLPDMASSLNSIQIQRGVGTSSNGISAFGATINLSTNEFNYKPYITFNNTYGSFNTLKNTLKAGTGLLHNHFMVDMRLSAISSNGFIDRATSHLQSFYLSGVYVDKKSSIRLNVFSGKEKTYQAWNGVPEAKLKGDIQGMKDIVAQNNYDVEDSLNLFQSNNRTYNYFLYENQTDNYQQDHYQLFLNHQYNNQWSFNITGFLTRGRGYYEEYKKNEELKNYPFPKTVIDTVLFKRSNLIRQLWLDNYFYGNTYALQYKSATDEIALGSSWSKYDGNHYGQIIWADAPIPHQYKWYNKNADKIDYNVYAKYNRSLHQNWNAFVDMQYKWTDYVIDGFRKNPDIYIHTKYSFFNPKIGIFYADKNGWSGYASFSKASKEPNRDDFETGLIQRPKPEHLYDYELSVEKKCTKASFSTVLYYMYYRDQLVLNGKLNDVGENTRMNVPQSYRLGLEFQATTKPIDWFEATAHVTWSKNKIKNFTAFVDDYDSGTQKTTYYKNTNISFSPNVIAGFTICFIPVKYFKIDLMNKYVSRQFLDNTSNKAKSLNAYDVQDVRLNYTIATKYCKALSIVAQINNIFNTQYESNGWTYSFMSGGKEMINNNYFPMAGTNIMVALHIDW